MVFPEILPPDTWHATPLACIDQVVAVGLNSITVRKTLASNELFFQGHYPHQPVFPGIFLFEAIHQAVSHHARIYHRKVRLVRIKKMRFFHPLKPGDYFECNCMFTTIPDDNMLLHVTGECLKDDKEIAKAEVFFRLGKSP